ncbi:MAG: alpha-galactosidase [Ruminococcaceae bacterium]|nr:alpha-galactosidase [Oscillospiraceae bacterium]
MAIHFDEASRVFYLHSKGCTYAFGINSLGMPEHIYFGSPVGEDLSFGKYSQTGRSHVAIRTDETGKAYDLSAMPQEFHTPYGGDFHTPSLVLSYANGSRRSDFTYTGFEILEHKPALKGLPALREGQTLAVFFAAKGVKLTLSYTVSEKAAAIARSMKIENLGSTPVRVEKAHSFAFTLPNLAWKAVYLTGASGAETHWQQTSLDRGVFTLDSKRGTTSAAMNPALAVGLPETGENQGQAYGVNLIYSGSWSISADRTSYGSVRVSGGISEFDFSWLLEPGESFQTPEAVLAYSNEGFSGLSRQFHDLYRESLIPRQFVKKPRPVIINNWEGTRFLFTLEKLKGMISRVAGTGIDTFVLDDGWFGKRDDASSGLGDWFVNEKKLGGPLKDLIDFTHGKGMRFGLWFEPEMVNKDSDLYRAHPDWVIRTPEEEPVEAREQLFLDLTREEVRSFIADTVNAVIRSHEIDYVKWDCNRDMTEGYSLALPPHRQKELMHRQVLGVYDLFQRIVEANPNVLFEGCASGGSRYDPAILYYFPQVWISDQTDAPARAKIQYGASLCYPLSSQSCHVTESPNRRAKHLTPFGARADMAHLGATGYELDATKLTDEELSRIPGQVAAYRADEDLVLEGDLYRLEAPVGGSNYFAVCLVSKDKTKGKLTVMRLQENFNEPERKLFPRGLDPQVRYYVPELDRTMAGNSWMHFGICPKFPDGDYETQVYHFRKENT